MKNRSFWAAFWEKAGAVSLQFKIMGIVAICIITSAFAPVWYAYRDVSTALRNQLQQRGIAIGNSLAAQSRDLILTDNQFGLYTLVKGTISADVDLAYVFVLDAEGSVLVHTFEEGFPTDLLARNKVAHGQAYQVEMLATDRDRIQDIAVPVLGGAAGTVRLGIYETTLDAAVEKHIRNILFWVALIFVFGLSIAYGLATILSEPVSQLAKATQAIDNGDFKWKAPVWAKDEIGSLGAAFSEMSEELKLKEKMREQLLAKVIDSQEEERKRIARELHDETSQSLASLTVGLKHIENSTEAAPFRERIAELRTLVVQTINSVHQLATGLRPSLLDDMGLVAALDRYTREYSVKMNIEVDYQVSGIGGQRFPADVEIMVFRIVQEALTNVAKYAEAKNVSVVLGRRGSAVVAIVEDNGKGFDLERTMASSHEKHLGLFGMYERASLIGGKLVIESQPSAGTTVFLEVPLKNEKEVADGQDKNTSGG